MRRPSKSLGFVLACASPMIVARAQSSPTPPRPGPEVQKVAFMVGKFTNEGIVKAGTMGSNSPAMKVSGTDECSWTAARFGLTCSYAYDVGGTIWAGAALVYYDPGSGKYRLHAINSLGEIEDQTGSVSGDIWTWNGKSSVGGKDFKVLYVTKIVSRDSWEYAESWGEREIPAEPSMSGKDTRVAISKPEKQNQRSNGASFIGWEANRQAIFVMDEQGMAGT
jgi:hypothetical protein